MGRIHNMTAKKNVNESVVTVNNFEVKKRPCGPVLTTCGFAYLFLMVLLFLIRSSL